MQTKVADVNEIGAYVVLLEYNNMQGLLLSSEVTRKRVNNVNRLIKIGKVETMVVLRVDQEKRYIDLSKKKVNRDDANNQEEIYKKAKMVHSIMKQCCEKLRAAYVEENKTLPEDKQTDLETVTLLSLYEKFGWDFYDKYEHANDAFRLIMSDPEEHLAKVSISEMEKTALLESISRRMTPKPLKICCDFTMNCPNKEGIYALRQAIRACKEKINDDKFEAEVSPPA